MRNCVFFLFFLLSPFLAYTQCIIVNAGKDVSICRGGQVQLNASGASTYTWSPASGLNDPNIPNPVASPLSTTTYIVSSPFKSGNTAINGDFSSGNTGFISQYDYVGSPGPQALWPEGTYTVGASPASYHSQWGGYGDHTTGSGSYLICNGAGTPNVIVWEQQIKVCPNTMYRFSCWALSMLTPGAILQFSINNALIGPTFTTPNAIGVWTQFSETWYSGTNTTALIRIVNQNQVASGNDFGLDDIFFESTGTSEDTVTVTVHDPPALSVNPISICRGDTGILSVSGADQYTWSAAAGLGVSSGGTVNVFPTASTVYTVTGINKTGCSSTATVTVSVHEAPVVSVSPISICKGDTGTLSAGGADQYTWWPAAGLGASSGGTVNVFPTASTVYTVTGINKAGCSSTATVAVAVKPCDINVTASGGTACFNQCTTISAAPGGGTAPYTYSWQPGNLAGASHTVCPTGSTTYTVMLTDGAGYTASAKATVTINPVPNIKTSATPVCSGKPATLTATGADAYSWSAGTSPLTGAVVTAAPSTTSTYTVLGVSSQGCTQTASVAVLVEPVPVITVNAATVCAGSFVTLTANGAEAYTWSTGENTKSIKVRPSSTTSYSVTGTSTAGCTGAATTSVVVYPLPRADFSTSPQPTTIFNPKITLKDLSLGAPVTWNWTLWDHTKDLPVYYQVQHPPEYSYSDTGTYLVKLVVASQYGCKDSINKYVVIGPEWSFYIPNTFTPNDDTKNDGFIGKSWNVIEHQMWIYDRWGNMIYTTGKTKDPESAVPWNGKANSGADIAQTDTYVWVVILKDIFNQKHKLIGHVNLIR